MKAGKELKARKRQNKGGKAMEAEFKLGFYICNCYIVEMISPPLHKCFICLDQLSATCVSQAGCDSVGGK